jgi:hypothetical protein
MTALVATTAFAFALVLSSIALAGHDEEFDPCAGLRGSAFGLCQAYTHGMRCAEESPMAGSEACERVATSLLGASGSPPPSDCPCNFSLDRIRDSATGWDTTDDFTCSGTDNQTVPIPDPLTFADRFFKEGLSLSDVPLLSDADDQASSLISAVDAPLRVFFSCTYEANGVVDEVVEELLGTASDYSERAVGFLNKYAACRGAVGTIIANTTFGSLDNRCTFAD